MDIHEYTCNFSCRTPLFFHWSDQVLAKTPSASFSGRPMFFTFSRCEKLARRSPKVPRRTPRSYRCFKASDFRIYNVILQAKTYHSKKTWWFWRRRVGKWNFINKNDDQDKVGLGGLRQPTNSASKSMEAKSGHSTNAVIWPSGYFSLAT
jgi:hypothetical protein